MTLMRFDRAKFLRFALVGAGNAVVYAFSTWVYIERLGLGEKSASVMGFCTAVPFAFLAHRAFTFSSQGIIGMEWRRFVATQLTSMATSVAAMWMVVDVLRLHFGYGVLAGIVLVPVLTYLALNLWVFRDQAGSERQGARNRR